MTQAAPTDALTPSIRRFRPDDRAASIAAEIRDNGVAVVERLFAPEVADLLVAKVTPALEQQEPGGGDFFGHRRRSVGALFARGEEFAENLLQSERVLEVVDAILLPEHPMAAATRREKQERQATGADGLPTDFHQRPDPLVGPNCHHYRINATVAMQVVQGGTNQYLHRDEWRYKPYMHRDPDGPELSLAIMVAGTDFTAANGATRFVPGSNRWPEGRTPTEAEVVQAVMPRGSAAFWLGSVYHGLGINHTNVPRTGFIYSFALDHLAQEENQFLSVPPDIAETLPPRAQQLLGYRMSATVNFVAGRDKDFVLRPGTGSVLD